MLQPNSNEQQPIDGFVCEFCGKRYVRERAFLRHTCKERERFELLQGPRGKLGLLMYNRWLQRKFRGKTVTADTFISTSSFSSIMKFVDWGLKMRFNSSMFERYVDFCVIKNYTPNMWLMNEVFVQFIQYIDINMTPREHIQQSFEWFKDMASAKNCELTDIFSHIMVGEIVQAILNRKVSPWVLVKTAGFKRLWASINDDAKNHLQQVINPEYWRKKMDQDPTGNELVASVVKQSGV